MEERLLPTCLFSCNPGFGCHDRSGVFIVLNCKESKIALAHFDFPPQRIRVFPDACIDHETLIEIRRIILQEPSAVEIGPIIGRNAGRFHFIQTNIIVRTKDLVKVHAVSNRLEQQIMRAIPNVQNHHYSL